MDAPGFKRVVTILLRVSYNVYIREIFAETIEYSAYYEARIIIRYVIVRKRPRFIDRYLNPNFFRSLQALSKNEVTHAKAQQPLVQVEYYTQSVC